MMNVLAIVYHIMRWLSWGTVLKQYFELRIEILNFMEIKGKTVAQLQSQKLVQDLAFEVDTTDH